MNYSDDRPDAKARDYERQRGEAIRDDPDAKQAFTEGVTLGWTEQRKRAYGRACRRASSLFEQKSRR